MQVFFHKKFILTYSLLCEKRTLTLEIYKLLVTLNKVFAGAIKLSPKLCAEKQRFPKPHTQN